MMMRVDTLCGSAALILLAAGPAAAAPATPEGAGQLQALFERYTGKPPAGAPSPVTVTPSGDDYRVDIDVARLAAPLGAFGITVAATDSYEATLTPNDDGTWRVRTHGFPPVAVTRGDQTTTLKYEGYATDGVYDPKLRAMREQTTTMGGLTGGTQSPIVSTEQHYTAQITAHQTARDAGDGSVTTDMHEAIANLAYAITMRSPRADPPLQAPLTVTANLPQASADLTLSHWATGPLLDLWAFLVAHPSKEAVKADHDRLKAILAAVVAPGPTGTVKADLGKLRVATPVGAFALDSFKEEFELGGDHASQTARFGLHYAGLTFPTDRVPHWAVQLVPTAMDLDFTFGPFHLSDGLREAVARADFGADAPLSDTQGDAVAKSFGDPAALALALRPSTLTSPLVKVSAEGTARADADGNPISDLTLTAKGVDQAMDLLNRSAPDDPNAAQVAAMLALAKQTAKAAGPGTYTWVVQMRPNRPPTVNGTPLAGPPAPDGDAPSSESHP